METYNHFTEDDSYIMANFEDIQVLLKKNKNYKYSVDKTDAYCINKDKIIFVIRIHDIYMYWRYNASNLL